MWHRRSYFNRKHASAIILLIVVSIFVLILPSSDHPGKDESDNVLKTTMFDTLESATQTVVDISNKYEEMDRYFVTLKNATCFREKRMANNLLSTVVRKFSGKLDPISYLIKLISP